MSIVGNYSLTFIQDGEYKVIGKLDPSQQIPIDNSGLCSSAHLSLDGLQDSCNSPYSNKSSSLASSPGDIKLLTNYSEEDAILLMNRDGDARQSSTFADDERLEHYPSGLVRQFSDRPEPQHALSQNQFTSNDCSSRSIQIICRYLNSYKISFNEELECDIKGLRDLLWSVYHMSLKCLVSELINSLYPMRRKLHPYSQGAPIPGWPEGVRYKDPAHIGVPERLALALWIYINPIHHPSRILAAHRKILAKHDLDQLGLIYNVAMAIRHTLWQEQ